MATRYDEHGLDRVITAMLANAIEDVTGTPQGVDHLKRSPNWTQHRRRMAINALDWLYVNGVEFFEHAGLDPEELPAWLVMQEGGYANDGRTLRVQSKPGTTAGELDVIRAGRPLPDRVGSVQHGRSYSAGRNGKVYRQDISGNHPRPTNR